MGYFQTKQGSIFEAVKKSLNVVEKKKVVDYSKVEYILPEDKEKYQKVFNAAMKKFKIKSPGELKSDEEKKKFFDYVDKNYKSDAEKKTGKEDPSAKDENKTATGKKISEIEIQNVVDKIGKKSIAKESTQISEKKYKVNGKVEYKGVRPMDDFQVVVDASSPEDAESKAFDALDSSRKSKKIGPGGGGSVDSIHSVTMDATSDKVDKIPSKLTF